jgi:hypothetical protein
MPSTKEVLEIIVDANVQGFVSGMEKAGLAAQKNIGDAENKVDKMAGRMQSYGAAMVGGASIAAIGLGKLATMAGEAEVAQAKLDNSIANSSQKFKDNGAALNDLASSLQKVTAADDESIKGAEALLVQFGLTEDQVANLTPLVVDLSRKMGIDMDTAAKAVGKSATGSATALNKMGINVKALGEGSTDAERTLSALQKSVGGFARGEAQTFSGQLAIAKNLLSELGETVGVGAAGTLKDIVGGFNGLAGRLTEVNPGLSSAVGSFLTLSSIGVGSLGALSFAAGSFLQMNDAVSKLSAKLTAADGQLKTFGKGLAVAGGAAAFAAITYAIIEIGNQFNKGSQDAEAFGNALLVLNGSAQGDQFTAFTQAVNANIGTLDTWSQKLDQVAEPAGETSGALETLSEIVKSIIVSPLTLFGGDDDLILKIGEDANASAIDLNQLGETLDKVNAAGSLTGLKAFREQLNQLKPVNDAQQEAIDEQKARADEMIKSATNQSAAQRNLAVDTKNTTDAARKQALETGKTADGLVQVSATAEDLKDKQNELALSTAGITQAFQINQAAAKGFASGLDVVTNSSNGLIDSAQTVGEAMKLFKAGADGTAAAMAALPTNGIDPATAALGGYTEEQNKAIDAFQQYGAAVQKNLAAQLASGASYDQVRQQAAGYEAFLRDYLVNTLGVAADKVDGYIQQLGLTPDQVNTQITLSGAEQAKQQLQVLQGDFDSLPAEKRSEIYAAISRNDWAGALQIYNNFKDKTVQVDINTRVNTQVAANKSGVPYNIPTLENAQQIDINGNGIIGQANGGILKFAAGGMTENRIAQIAPAGAMRLWAEPETGGESYIPLAPSKRKRSMAIWQKTGELLGAQTGRTSGVAIGSINITESQNARLTAAELVRVQRDEAFLMGVS